MRTRPRGTTYTYTDSNDNTTSTLPASTLSITLTNLEAAATYEVQVRAGGNNEGLGDWSDSGEGRVNRPPEYTRFAISPTTIPWGETRQFDLADSEGELLRGRGRRPPDLLCLRPIPLLR